MWGNRMAFDLDRKKRIKEQMSVALTGERVEEQGVKGGNGFILPKANKNKEKEKRAPMTLNAKPSIKERFSELAKKQGYKSASDFFEELVLMIDNEEG